MQCLLTLAYCFDLIEVCPEAFAREMHHDRLKWYVVLSVHGQPYIKVFFESLSSEKFDQLGLSLSTEATSNLLRSVALPAMN